MARFADIILRHLQDCEDAPAHIAAFRVPVGVELPVVNIVKNIAALADQADLAGQTVQGSFRFHDLLDAFKGLVGVQDLGGRLSASRLQQLIDELKVEADK